MVLVTSVNRLRINPACQLLMGDDRKTITDICFSSGCNNISNFISNFNRQLQALKGVTHPSSVSRWRATSRP